MRIKFKEQQFQKDAVKSVVDCFLGQPKSSSKFTYDKGFSVNGQLTMDEIEEKTGQKNKNIRITSKDVYKNITEVQKRNGLKISPKLEGEYNLTIEMETGTGKTYTYIRTMHELFEKYGWSKYIIVVPSVAIREGIYKSFQLVEDHFQTLYNRKVRYFIYDSSKLSEIEHFATDTGINVMIINMQAFNSRRKDARRIHMELDSFNSRKPIDVIGKTRPILIIDEPQSVEGRATKKRLKDFNALFTLRYSATHKEEYNKIYRLDALDAYNKKLVKKINVKGISQKGTTGTNSYVYLEEIIVSKKKPEALISFQKKTNSGIKTVTKRVKVSDRLYELSGELEQYKDFTVKEIDARTNSIEFLNSEVIFAGEVVGDVTESQIRRIQIRETIKSHLEKERILYKRGIKVLSLFFIDRVENYRLYEDKDTDKGIYAQLFEEEYRKIVNEFSRIDEEDYKIYLDGIQAKETHQGYFSKDRKGKFKNTGGSSQDDITTYDLIMKDKERLLSLAEPVRFIFSHSALKEGWDNTNVFQICTLKHSDSSTRKRQEVGRGMRLCVDKNGNRIDQETPGIDVHDVNILTVIASESYENFAKDLQSEIADTLSDRPQKADVKFFIDRVLTNERGEKLKIDKSLAKKIHNNMIRNDYLDDDDNIKDSYYEALEKDEVVVHEEIQEYKQSFVEIVKEVYDATKTEFSEDGRKPITNELNDNFHKDEFKKLWNKINVKTAFEVKFDSDELVKKCIKALDEKLKIRKVLVEIAEGEMNRIDDRNQLEEGRAFERLEADTPTESIYAAVDEDIKYDILGKFVSETKLTRRTIAKILQGIRIDTFSQFRRNPEDFIIKASKLINEQKASLVIEKITYNKIDGKFQKDIFTNSITRGSLDKNAIETKKHIYDHLITDSNVEREFAKELEGHKEVSIYAKLPKGFFINTPVGNYNPDWAIVFDEKDVKHVYFIAETKGSLDSLEFREVEKAKIECAKKHFSAISDNTVKYDVVDSYDRLMDLVKS